jgi:hypothetical protein
MLYYIKVKLKHMDDYEQNQNMETNIFREYLNKVPYVGNVLQSIRLRHCTILSDSFNREFILRKPRFVLYIGTILWIIFLLSKII